MAPKTKSGSSAATMKQGTLSFASSKRNASATLAGKANVKPASPATTAIKAPAPVNEKGPTRRASTQSQGSTTDEDENVLMLSTSPEPMAKRQKVSSGPSKVVTPSIQLPKPVESSESESESDSPPGDLDALEKSARVRRQFGLARQKMGSVQPVHSEGKTMAFQILRVFDTSYEYGPCVGVTRLERWERAQMLGLNPPFEVRDILTTKQGMGNDIYKQNVFYGEVA